MAYSEMLGAGNTTISDSNRVDETTPGNCSAWPPPQLRTPSVSGARGDVKFAFFADKRRLLIERAGELALYDCGDHMISGMRVPTGQAQSLVFTSQQQDELPLGTLRQLS